MPTTKEEVTKAFQAAFVQAELRQIFSSAEVDALQTLIKFLKDPELNQEEFAKYQELFRSTNFSANSMSEMKAYLQEMITSADEVLARKLKDEVIQQRANVIFAKAIQDVFGDESFPTL